MPSTFGGLVLFVAFLTPGFIYYVQRRRIVELKAESPLVETARLLSVSVLTNLVTVGAFAAFRYRWRSLTPDPRLLFQEGWRYVESRLGFVVTWWALLLVFSCLLGYLLAQLSRSSVNIRWLVPDVVNTSAWNEYLGNKKTVPTGMTPFVGLTLGDGVYMTGFVDWISTELDEVPDRDLVLVEPIRMNADPSNPDSPFVKLSFSRVIVSARDIARLYVSYYPYSPTFGDDEAAKADPSGASALTP